MTKKQNLTVAELKSLILARFNAEQSNEAKLRALIQREFGNEIQEEKPETIAIKNKFADWSSDVLARRLKRNRRATPLLSYRDFVQFIPSILDVISQARGYELEAEERKMFEKFTKAMFQNLFEVVRDMIILPGKNPYEEYWRWANTVFDLAAERGVLPTELLALEGATDEIMRRMFSKKQFGDILAEKVADRFTSADVLKKIVIQPMLDMVAEGDEEERRDLERDLEAELMPQVREIVEKSKVVINAWLDEEIARIYATA
ncbi:MAG: hypothetical protein Q7S82_02230 [bacterium]|nr:hypothetical protein [bacterium]